MILHISHDRAFITHWKLSLTLNNINIDGIHFFQWKYGLVSIEAKVISNTAFIANFVALGNQTYSVKPGKGIHWGCLNHVSLE